MTKEEEAVLVAAVLSSPDEKVVMDVFRKVADEIGLGDRFREAVKKNPNGWDAEDADI